MKILAVRGCNLASLAGEFELDLERDPLGAAGVFAIVGNTGAGKSTLLDALCVALFDRTPRLTNHSRVVVGRGDEDPGALGSQDVRTLLRRGAASGWAEVDFESGDARRYRARWAVRRARNHVDGAIQPQQVTLIELGDRTSARLGGTKTETLEAIHARLGLTFDQFRRSALLAQGEFAAFLRADGKDRSELLERMTGTEIYTRLSIAAHARATAAAQRLGGLRSAALAIVVLDEAVRDTVRAELQLAESARDASRERLAVLERARGWFDEHARRLAAVAESERTHADLEARAPSVAVLAEELDLRRRIEALRGACVDATRLAIQRAELADEIQRAKGGAERASAERDRRAERRAVLESLYAPVRAARIAAGLVERAPVDPAGPLDLVDVTADRAAIARDAGWLAERAGLATEVARWRDTETRFAQQVDHEHHVRRLDGQLAATSETRAAVAVRRAELQDARRDVQGRVVEAQRKAERFLERRALPLEAARRAEDEARHAAAEAERLVAIAAAARDRRATRQAAIARRDAVIARVACDRAARDVADARHQVCIAVRDERARALDELRRAAGYEHARAELRDGEPCLLCGATEHPWATRGSFDVVIAAAAARLQEASGDLDANLATLAHVGSSLAQCERERIEAEATIAAVDAQLDAATAEWRAQLAALGELLLVVRPDIPEAEQLARERATGAAARLEDARTIRHQTEAATKAVAEAQAEARACQAALDHVTHQVGEADLRLAELDAKLEVARVERRTRSERLAEIDAELDAAIAPWLHALPECPPARGRDRASHLAEVRARIGELSRTWMACAERVAVHDATVAAARVAADEALADAERQVAAAQARVLEVERQEADIGSAAMAAERAFVDRCTAVGLTVERVRELLAQPASRADELAATLASHDRACTLARGVLEERRRHVTEHVTGRPRVLAELAPSGDARDALDRARIESEHQLASAETHVARLAGALAADVDARTRQGRAFEDLATAERDATVDRTLGQVIGSHDGKLFRSFAQSLTLDSLLSLANAHLDDLAPRYQLERVPRHDLEIQVIDRDLGDEIRSVQSLSGGESFLVSLALALGLSSMSAHDVRVRTLLIDEGFGTLDPGTLETALNVLDELQARGRQVGVISHVPALVERVKAHVRVVPRGGGRSEVIVA